MAYSTFLIVTNCRPIIAGHSCLIHSPPSKTNRSIIAFDLDGNEIWVKSNVEDDKIKVFGNKIYIYGDILRQYIDTGGECDFVWEWVSSDESFVYLLNVDINENLYVGSSIKMSILTSDGQFIKPVSNVELGGHNRFVEVTNEGEFFVGKEEGLYKYSNDGIEIWRTELKEGYVRPNFWENNISIAQNGNIYCGSGFGLYVYRPDGALDWHIGLYFLILPRQYFLV